MSSACYNPNVFRPTNTPLLAKGQWSMVQLFLVDAANLPLTTSAFPDDKALPIFRKIHDASAAFASSVLPKSMATGSSLYSYGQTSLATFSAVVRILEQDNPDRTVLSSLFGNLTQAAATAKDAAGDLFSGTKAFVDELSRQKPLLERLVSDEVTSTGGLKSQIDPLSTDIEAQRAVVKAAQVAITEDQKVIHDTVYYSWIPFIGTIVALGEALAKQSDISSQMDRIHAAVQQIEADNRKLLPLQSQMNQLIYAQGFNNDQIAQVAQVTPVLQRIEGAWGTINQELGAVLGQISTAQDPRAIPCLAEVALTTATNEWHDIANDAHDYMTNFYVADPVAAGAAASADTGTVQSLDDVPSLPGRRRVVRRMSRNHQWETIVVDRFRSVRGSALV